MVWRFDGDVARVAQVAVTSTIKKGGTPAAGVAGIRAERVSFVRGRCLSYFRANAGAETDQARGVLLRSLGRAPDAMLGAENPRSISLPSGEIEAADHRAPPPPLPGFDAASWKAAIRFWPAGIGSVDPRSVVSKLPVAPYDILPSQMGISQLLGAGALVRGSGGSYHIVRPIAHYPAEMAGAHAETLVIDAGVPVPAGDPGHSCVKMADGSEASGGANCP